MREQEKQIFFFFSVIVLELVRQEGVKVCVKCVECENKDTVNTCKTSRGVIREENGSVPTHAL